MVLVDFLIGQVQRQHSSYKHLEGRYFQLAKNMKAVKNILLSCYQLYFLARFFKLPHELLPHLQQRHQLGTNCGHFNPEALPFEDPTYELHLHKTPGTRSSWMFVLNTQRHPAQRRWKLFSIRDPKSVNIEMMPFFLESNRVVSGNPDGELIVFFCSGISPSQN